MEKLETKSNKKISKSYKKVYDNNGDYKYVAVDHKLDLDEWEYETNFTVLSKIQRDSIIRMLNIIEAKDIEDKRLYQSKEIKYEISIGKVNIAVINPTQFSELMEEISESTQISDIVFFNPIYNLDRKILFSMLGKLGTKIHTFKQQDSLEKSVFNHQLESENYSFKRVMQDFATMTDFKSKPIERIRKIP